MKKVVLNYLVIAALALAAAFTSCGGGSSSGSSGGKSSGKIKMTTEQGGSFSFQLAGNGVATVDWGDGSEKVSLTLNEERGVEFTHTYPNATIRTITINGDNITRLQCRDITSLDVRLCSELTILGCSGTLTSLDVSKNTMLIRLDCGYNQLTSLDVSRNTALTELLCNRNQLTNLDISKNTALTELYCGGNQLKILNVSKNTALTRLNCNSNQLLTGSALNALFETLHSNTGEKIINIFDVPGANDCDRSIAERKGWTVR